MEKVRTLVGQMHPGILTHMQYYQMKPLFDIVSPSQAQEEGEQAPVAGGKFEPLYFVRTYPSDRSKIEMSFDL